MKNSRYEPQYVLCNRQQIVSVNAFVVHELVVLTYPTSVDHYASLRVSLWVKQVVAFLAEM